VALNYGIVNEVHPDEIDVENANDYSYYNPTDSNRNFHDFKMAIQ